MGISAAHIIYDFEKWKKEEISEFFHQGGYIKMVTCTHSQNNQHQMSCHVVKHIHI